MRNSACDSRGSLFYWGNWSAGSMDDGQPKSATRRRPGHYDEVNVLGDLQLRWPRKGQEASTQAISRCRLLGAVPRERPTRLPLHAPRHAPDDSTVGSGYGAILSVLVGTNALADWLRPPRPRLTGPPARSSMEIGSGPTAWRPDCAALTSWAPLPACPAVRQTRSGKPTVAPVISTRSRR